MLRDGVEDAGRSGHGDVRERDGPGSALNGKSGPLQNANLGNPKQLSCEEWMIPAFECRSVTLSKAKWPTGMSALQCYQRKDFCSPNKSVPSQRVTRQAVTSPIVLYSSPAKVMLVQRLNQPPP